MAAIIDFPTCKPAPPANRKKAMHATEQALWKGKPSSYIFPPIEVDDISYSIQINLLLDGWIWEAKRIIGDSGSAYDVEGRKVTPKVTMRIREEPSVVYETPAEALDAAQILIRKLRK